MTLRVDSWSDTSTLVVLGLDACALLLLLALYDLKRFWWAGRGATGIVFIAFVAYFADEIHSGKPWRFGSRSEETPLNALLGLIFIGLPCLRYTLTGRFGSGDEIESGTDRMIDRQTAIDTAEKWISRESSNGAAVSMDLCLVPESTIETDFGWIFFYTSRQYRETGDFKYAIAGNAPIIIDRLDGSLHVTGTAFPIEHYVEEYRRTRRPADR